MLKRIAISIVLVLALAAVGSGGYYAGLRSSAATPTPYPTYVVPAWTDLEIRATGTQGVGTLHCTYHMTDGTTRIRDEVIALETTSPFFRGPSCPSAP